MRKSFSPSPVCKRLITSFGRTTPRELPNLRTLSSTTSPPVITIVITSRTCSQARSADNREARNPKPTLVAPECYPEPRLFFQDIVNEQAALLPIFAPD